MGLICKKENNVKKKSKNFVLILMVLSVQQARAIT